MSEKRFQKGLNFSCFDTENRKSYGYAWNLCGLLNEQHSTIQFLKEENDILKQKLRKNYIANKQYEEMKRLQDENEQLRQILKDIVVATDETYTKDKSIYKVSVVFDYKTYLKLMKIVRL